MRMDAKRRLPCWELFPGLIVVLIAAVAFAQRNQKQKPATTLRVASHLVTVNAVVEDKNGSPLTDLKPSDFEILDGGQAQRISFFSTFTDTPPATHRSRQP
jgi:hypothetical protein